MRPVLWPLFSEGSLATLDGGGHGYGISNEDNYGDGGDFGYGDGLGNGFGDGGGGMNGKYLRRLFACGTVLDTAGDGTGFGDGDKNGNGFRPIC